MKVIAPNLIVSKEELLLDFFFSQACNFRKHFSGQLYQLERCRIQTSESILLRGLVAICFQ